MRASGDHVDLAADESDLQLAQGVDVDDAGLAGVDDPFLHGCFSSLAIYRVSWIIAIYRELINPRSTRRCEPVVKPSAAGVAPP